MKLPHDLATGRSYRINFELAEFEMELVNESDMLGFDVTYKVDDLATMRLRVTDGEGHDHWASLAKDSLPHIRAIIDARKRRKKARDEAKNAAKATQQSKDQSRQIA